MLVDLEGLEAELEEEGRVEAAEVIEVHATTGDADYLIKVVARDTGHLHRITNRILAIEGVVRSNTVISLSQVMGNRTRPLLEHRASDQRA